MCKIAIAKILKQLVTIVCLISLFFSSPGIAFASQNIETESPKRDLTIIDKNIIHNGDNITTENGNIIINKKHDNSNFSLGALAGGIVGGLSSVGLVSISGSITGLSAAGISTGLATIGGIVGGGMAAGLAVSAALPVAGVAGGLFVVQQINQAWTSHQQEHDSVSEGTLTSSKQATLLPSDS